MIKRLVTNLVKRYAIEYLRGAIRARGDAVRTWAARLKIILAKARLVVAFLERLVQRLEDGELSQAEVERTELELGILAGEVTR